MKGVAAKGKRILDAIGLDGAESVVDLLRRYVGASKVRHGLHADHILHLVGDDSGMVILRRRLFGAPLQFLPTTIPRSARGKEMKAQMTKTTTIVPKGIAARDP